MSARCTTLSLRLVVAPIRTEPVPLEGRSGSDDGPVRAGHEVVHGPLIVPHM